MPKTHKERSTLLKSYYPYIATKLREYGCHSVPIRPGTKKPDITGWPIPLNDEEFADACAKFRKHGTGILLGESSNIVAIDLDLCETDPLQNEILNRISHLIPDSPIERVGEKGFVRFYKFSSETNYSKNFNFYDPKKKELVKIKPLEIHGDGRQAVLPPSRHPSGINYKYTKGSLESFANKINLPQIPADFIENYEIIIKQIQSELLVTQMEIAISETPDVNPIKVETSLSKETGRNDKLKSMAVAALKKGLSEEQIINELVEYDSKNHKPPLFTDNTHGYGLDANKSALTFVTSIKKSILIKTKDFFTTLDKLETLKEFEKLTYLVDDLLPIPGVSIVAGKPKIGKTSLALDMVVKICRGKSVFERNTLQVNVMLIALENNLGQINEYLKKMLTEDEFKKILISYKPISAKNIDTIKAAIDEHKIGFVVIDTMVKFLRCSDLNDYGKMTIEMDVFSQLAAEAHVHILTTHHTVKSSESRGTQTILGSTAVTAGVDTLIYYDGSSSQTVRAVKSQQRYGTPIDLQLDYDPVSKTFTELFGEAADSQAKAAKAILNKIADSSKPLKRDQITVGFRKQIVTDVLQLLCDQGKIKFSGSGKKNDPKVYSVPLDTH